LFISVFFLNKYLVQETSIIPKLYFLNLGKTKKFKANKATPTLIQTADITIVPWKANCDSRKGSIIILTIPYQIKYAIAKFPALLK
jgi:hypothetical protein